MFYEPRNGHGLPYDPLKAIIAPRPIGWISSLDRQGRPNLAPFSYFSAIANRPPMVAFTSEGAKDTAEYVRDTGEFVCNLSTLKLAREMNVTSTAVKAGVDEFEFAGLTPVPCRIVRPPRVAESPAALECVLTKFFEIDDMAGTPVNRFMAIGQVVGVYIDDAYIKDGRFDTAAAQPLARCGYYDYAAVTELFEMKSPPKPTEPHLAR